MRDYWLTSGSRRGRTLSLLVDLCGSQSGEGVDPSDWEAVAQAALDHGLLSFVAPQLKVSAGLQGARWLDRMVRLIAQQNLHFVAESLRVARALSEQGITAALFKGCLLSQLAHGAGHLRQIVDLDFVVARKDLDRAIAALGKCGYALDQNWTAAIREGHFYYDCECCLYNAERRLCIDLHWEFTPRNYNLPVGIDAFFDRLQPVPFHGQPVLTFSPEDQIIALCLHGTKHYWQRLEWLYTVAALLRRYPALDLDLVLERSRKVGLRHIIACGLLLAEEIFDAPLPSRISQAVRLDEVAWRLGEISMRWVANASSEPPPPFEVRCFHALSRTNWIGKLTYWIGVVATPTEKDFARPLPRTLYPLYVVLRIVRLLQEAFSAPRPPKVNETNGGLKTAAHSHSH